MPRGSEQLDFFDLLIVLVENLWQLIIVTLLATIIAWIYVAKQPEKFVSEAIILLPPHEQLRAANMLIADQVLIGALTSLQVPLTQNTFREQISVVRSRDGLLHVKVSSDSPAEAQKKAKSLLVSWLNNSLPSENERRELKKQLSIIRSEHLFALRLLEEAALKSNSKNGYSVNPDALSKLLEVETEYLQEMLKISKILGNEMKNSIIQEPTWRAEADGPNKKLIIFSTGLFSFGCMLFFVFTRFFWNRASTDPVLAAKQKKFISAFKFSKRFK